MIRGTCFINDTHLISIINTGATHSFISCDYVSRLDLVVSVITINTPSSGFIATKLVCLNCPLSMYDRNFEIELIFLLLDQLDVILAMNWLSFKHLHINSFYKIVSFPKFERINDPIFISSNQVERSLK